ncbi:MAG: rRNA pseudouridine synthase, partial [SAR202 cluster bacterium]|nr:rRNA pseudouridine synthase [SAR202 cluster bacterium]
MERRSNRPPNDAPLTLVKYLVHAGLGSRRACAELIRAGRVRVNGKVATGITDPVPPGARVEAGGRRVAPQSKPRFVYLAVNKPAGYLSTVRDEHDRPTVLNLVPQALRAPGLVPAGRLDLDSAGLMLLTNDGDLVLHVTHPRYEVQKEYHVVLDAPLSSADRERLLAGVPLPDGVAHAIAISRLDADAPAGVRAGMRYSVTVAEGQKREVRLLMDAVGRTVRELVRVRIGPIVLDDLGPGKARQLSREDLDELRRVARVGQPDPEPRPAPAPATPRQR